MMPDYAPERMCRSACCGCEYGAEKSGRDEVLTREGSARYGSGQWQRTERHKAEYLIDRSLAGACMMQRRGVCRRGHALRAFPITPPPFYSFFSRDRRRQFQERREEMGLKYMCLRGITTVLSNKQDAVRDILAPQALRRFSAVSEAIWQKIHQVQLDLVGDKTPPFLNTLLASISTSAMAVALPSPKSTTKKKLASPYAGLPSPPVGTPAAPLRPRRRVRSGQKKPKWVKELPPSSIELAREIAVASEVNWSGFIRPVDKIWEVSSDFGPRWGRHHNGVDLAAPQGEPVLAADGGIVSFAGFEPTGYGYLVEITHHDGWRTLYAHNSSVYTWEGQPVKRGECIASVGATGRATGPHLHWEIRNRWGSPVDPAGYVEL